MGNIDNREDNAGRIQEALENTKDNVNFANQVIEKTVDKKLKEELIAKNQRREKAITNMEHEIIEEKAFQQVNQ